jgi:PPOX class probable F420-dependent enzyme
MENHDTLTALVQGHRIGHLASVDPHAVPHIVPVCFVYDGVAIYSAIDHKPKRTSGYGLKRLQNIVQNPQVAFLVDHYEEDWPQLYYVLIRGTATILEGGPERQRALHMLEDKYPQYRERHLAGSAGLVIKILPTSVRHWGWHDALPTAADMGQSVSGKGEA